MGGFLAKGGRVLGNKVDQSCLDFNFFLTLPSCQVQRFPRQ